MFKILTINPGSTSTKIGIFEDEKMVKEYELSHSAEELSHAPTIEEEIEFRSRVINDVLREAGIDLNEFSAISCRGGIIKPVPSGTYEVNEAIIHDSIHADIKHPANLAAVIGNSLAKQHGIKAYITDTPSTYEATPIAAVSGCPLISRPMTFHALNHKAIARRHCHEHGLNYNEVTLVVAHLGGGVSIGVHDHGRVVDVTDALSEGPFTPERSGGLPLKPLVDMCYSGKYKYEEIRKFIRGDAGFQAYLGTNDFREVLRRVEAGDEKAAFYFEAFVYQVAKDIGAMATVAKGKIDGILITGGVAYSKLFIAKLLERISFLGPVFIYPGQQELKALNTAVLAVLRGQEVPKDYK